MLRSGPVGEGDDARRLILARRARFVAAALASVAVTAGVAAGTEACGGGVEQTDAGSDAAPRPCLDIVPDDAAPRPCLDIAPDASDDDAGPKPCLAPPLDDGG